MADTRKDRRAPAAMRVKYKSATVEQFIEQSGLDISAGGIFVKTKKPLKIGSLLKFEFQLSDASPVMSGVGRVAWRREADSAGPGQPPGMGLKFLKLDGDTQALVNRIVEERQEGGSRFDDAGGAEIAQDAFSVGPLAEDSSPGPAPASPSPGSGSGPRPALGSGSGSGPRPASIPSPPSAVAPGGVAGLFGSSMAPGSSSEAAGGSANSFFGKPKADDQVRDASEFLASAFSGGGASEDTAAAAREQAQEAKRASEAPPPSKGMLPDDLWDDADSERPPESGDPPQLGSGPSQAPDSGDSSESPARDSQDFVSSEPPAADSGQSGDVEADNFGEMDFNASLPPAAADAPVATLSQSPAPRSSAPPAAASEEKSRGGVLAVIAVLVLAGGGGGYYMMTQGNQAQSARSSQASAPAKPAEAPPEPAQGQGAEAAPGPAEPSGEPVDLSITSRPRNAQVAIGGKRRGETPMKTSLPGGVELEIVVSAEGYLPMRRKVTPGREPSLHFELTPLDYEVIVASDPSGAEISAGDQTVTAPGMLQLGHIEGTVSISAVKEGYRRTSRPVRLDEFKLDKRVMRTSLNIALSPLPGRAAAPKKARARPGAKKKKKKPRKRPSKDKAPAAAESEALPDNPF